MTYTLVLALLSYHTELMALCDLDVTVDRNGCSHQYALLHALVCYVCVTLLRWLVTLFFIAQLIH